MDPPAPLVSLSMLGLALIPGALTAYLAFQSGGFFPGAPALVAANLALLLAARAALWRRPLEGVGPALLVATVALAGFAAWTLASSGWSAAPARAVPEYVRVLCYLLALVAFGVLPYSARRLRWMAYGFAAAIVGVCAAAFVSHTLPDLLHRPTPIQADRLSYPLNYWNALGLLAGLGVVLCGHFACDARGNWAVRVAGAAAVPLLSVTLFFTFSRGAGWATVVAVAVYLVVARPRGALAGALATAPPAALALTAANPATALTSPSPLASTAVAAGHEVALVVAGCVLAAGAIRALLLPLDRRMLRMHLPRGLSRPLRAGAGAAALAAGIALSAWLHVPEVVADKYRDFNSDETRPGDSGSSRFLSASDNGRRDHWQVALAAFRRAPLHGEGADTFEIAWMRDRYNPAPAQDAHSLYLETLGELGVPGLAALATCLLLLLGGLARRARGPDRALFGALLAAGVAWALAAAVDWAWEVPAVTLWLFAFGGAALARAPDDEARAARSGKARVAGVALRALAVAGCVAVAMLPARLAVSEAHLEQSIEELEAGNCTTARGNARSALDALGRRAAPHHVIGWCELRERRFAAAAQSFARGLRHDPHSWALRQASAVARAAAGLDPRADARLAAHLNPGNALVQATARMASRGTSRARRRAVRRLGVVLPELGDR